MKISREAILEPLQMVSGVVDSNRSNQLLSLVLFKILDDKLYLIGSDLDTEIRACIKTTPDLELDCIAVPGKKFLDICKSLPAHSELKIELLSSGRMQISTEHGHFSLPLIKADNFPLLDDLQQGYEFEMAQGELKKIISQCYFSMAHNDVRMYLVGMLWEIANKKFRAVASDGHRLSIYEKGDGNFDIGIDRNKSLIVPRKSILELLRILADDNTKSKVSFTDSYLKVASDKYVFCSKLINSRYPSYEALLPKAFSFKVSIAREMLKGILQRVAILSNEKSKAVRLALSENILTMSANNKDTEHAEERIALPEKFANFEICFNYQYMLDVLSVIAEDSISLSFIESNKPILVTGQNDESLRYLIMPMKL